MNKNDTKDTPPSSHPTQGQQELQPWSIPSMALVSLVEAGPLIYPLTKVQKIASLTPEITYVSIRIQQKENEKIKHEMGLHN